jgi:hypothetical protein
VPCRSSVPQPYWGDRYRYHWQCICGGLHSADRQFNLPKHCPYGWACNTCALEHHCSTLKCPYYEQKREQFFKQAWRLGKIPQGTFVGEKLKIYYTDGPTIVFAPEQSHRPEAEPQNIYRAH